MADYGGSSPYYKTTNTRFYLGRYVDRPIPSDGGDILVELTAKYENRPDLLAYDLYGDTRLWWVFYRRNLNIIKDPIFDFVAGMQIYVPSKAHVSKVVI